MNVANLNRLPHRTANLSRTGHDMSQEFAFTASTGMILPVYQDYLNAGETDYYSGSLIVRCQPLVTAAMCDVDIYLDWFFVPAQMLFTLFGSKRWMTNDLISSFYDDSLIKDDVMPLYDIQSYVKMYRSPSLYGTTTQGFYTDGYNGTFECLGKSTFRLLNHFGFNPYGIFEGDSSAAVGLSYMTNPNVFPLFPLAYQAIYQDYFRLPLDSYQRRRVTAFNVDKEYATTSTAYSHTAQGNDASLFCLHYRPRHLDYFTSLKNSPVMSAVNSLGSFSDVNSIFQRVDSYLDREGVRLTDDFGVSSSSGSGSSLGSTTQASLIEGTSGRVSSMGLRRMFAVEKLARVIGRAKMDYDSQVLAHFGFKVPHDVKHELSHLKTQHTVLHIGEVISTSDTYSNGSGSALGAIGGKGYGIIRSTDKPFKFTAPVDGVIMCTFSAVPRMRYSGVFDKQNSLTDRISFYQPEFDKLGMQPLFAYETSGFQSSYVSYRVGWQFRYEQWKRKVSRVSEAFAIPVQVGQLNQSAPWVVSMRPFGVVNSAGTYSPGTVVNFQDLVSRPSDLNSCMVVPYTGTWNSAYLTNPQTMFYTDPFICQFRANVKKVSVMSAYGEPDLGDI